MISDVLFEAIRDIDVYLADLGHVYKDCRDEIIEVRNQMENLQIKLDNPEGVIKNEKPIRVDF